MFSLATILLASIALAIAQWAPVPVAPPNPWQNTIVSAIQQDTVGNFGYQTADGQSRSQTVSPDGSIRGQYSYVDANNRPVTVNYIADRHGYRAVGDNVPLHAQHVPAPDPAASTNPWASSLTASHQSYSRPLPYQQQISWNTSPITAAATWNQPAATAVTAAFPGQPAPIAHNNPAAEQQLAQTVIAHHHNDQRLQMQQLQQLESITRAQNLHTPAASIFHPFG